MYKKMYETQAQWGEQQVPADDIFRGFASDFGLDMAAFDAAYDNPATLERINLDVADGVELGVQGTPTFFNGNQVQFRSYEEAAATLDQALSAQ